MKKLIKDKGNGYSEEYKAIRNEISKWPNWKIAIFNANFATSLHAHKIPMKDEVKEG